ncbi:MAG: GGDEF domain-containing protein [Spirochaetaceae bacterium]|nr:MAG: GGDEF domain-containing protein [Spirochaetaceae bacterium]
MPVESKLKTKYATGIFSSVGRIAVPALPFLPATLLVFLPSITQQFIFRTGLQFAAYSFLAFTILISLWFHRARPFLAAVTLLLLMLSFASPLRSVIQAYQSNQATNLLLIILSLLLIWMALSPRRTIISPINLVWLLGIMAAIAGAWAFSELPQFFHVANRLITADFLPPQIPNLPIYDSTAVLAGLSLICMIIFSLDPNWLIIAGHARDNYIDSAWLTVYLGTLLGLFFSDSLINSALFFTASAAGLSIALIRHAHAMAFIDALTQIPNRRALEDHLDRLGNSYSIAMVDIDHFKQFNDTHGHKIGDQVLKKTAGILRQVEGGAKAYRYGGEEFTIIFPSKSADEAAKICQALREKVAAEPFIRREKKRPPSEPKDKQQRLAKDRLAIYITISMGVAEKMKLTSNPADVIQVADQALYQAKKQGRNRVIIARSKHQ